MNVYRHGMVTEVFSRYLFVVSGDMRASGGFSTTNIKCQTRACRTAALQLLSELAKDCKLKSLRGERGSCSVY